ncbi:MAG TPA: HAMP domain-containing sensor histidine kinase [Lentimicrobium sp.]|nr:HAMP domain-containing sensor histidine kinase [Lentimicrobium sp.]
MTLQNNKTVIANSNGIIETIPETKGIQLYYLLLKDKDGNSLSYNYCGVWSTEPYSGFQCELPAAFKDVVSSLIDEGEHSLSSFREYTITSKNNESECSFLITQNRLQLMDSDVYQYVIRPTDNLNPILEECNNQLRFERMLNKMNFKCISSVSHDFRTPLSIIYANLQLLEYHEFQLDQETIEDAFSLSRMAVKSLLRVLDKVTVVDSINKGKLEYKPSMVNIRSVCENLVKELNEAEVLPNRVQYIHDESIGEIKMDDYLFRSLFTHLIFNALSYSKKNHNVLFESVSISPNHVRFIVEDHGIGLTSEQISEITVYFADQFQHQSEKIGLGLAIVKECLILLKGTLTLASEPGQGSVFIIDLPINLESEERGKDGHAN